MSKDNPLWGAPRIHGELLKLGIKISQATWRPKVPSPTWRASCTTTCPTLLRIDMFVVVTARFQLLYTGTSNNDDFFVRSIAGAAGR